MLGKILVSRYKICEELGRGGFGQTFIAEDIHLPSHPKCVIKQLKPKDTRSFVLESARKLFDREAQTLYKLGKHSQIPALLAHFEEENEFYLAQEMIEGVVLSQEIIPGKKLSDSFTFWLLEEVLQTLEFVHQQNVIHRDIKPSNLIKRASDGKVVLIDFGAVKETSIHTISHQGYTSFTLTIGSPGYMPDEQANGRPKFASDIYATGMMCIHALTGVTPSQMPEDQKTGEIIWRDLVPNINSELADFLDKMTRPHFSQRFQNGTEALAALQNLQRPSAFDSTIIPIQLTEEAIASINEPNSTIVSADLDTISPSVPISPISIETPSTVVLPTEKEEDVSAINLVEPINLSPQRKKYPYVAIGVVVITAIASISGYLFWQQAETNKRLEAIEKIRRLKAEGKYQECIDRAKAIASVNDSLTIQGLQKECFNGLSEIEGKAQLLKAQNFAKDNKFKEAIAIATKINPTSSVYPESQNLIEQWSQQILGIATTMYEEGKLKESITLLQEIPLNTPTGRKIPLLTNQWQTQFEKERKALELAKIALSQGRWEEASAELDKVTLPFFRRQIIDWEKIGTQAGVISTPVTEPAVKETPKTSPPVTEPAVKETPKTSPPVTEPPVIETPKTNQTTRTNPKDLTTGNQ
ncbi:protein kinase domain-containing protein [Phormidium tenue]|uniref:non-specific serine/threonine protein kinase n=1 Tax=Phormidium tenue FACHB-1050 TaxID=2692857 RepID=A0ABR8CAQ8_9CYAN|nr:serine/threonine-protein kinase [Phormidium tenue]MBD2317629.1 protein kinase [Phormidium tenue FACHB-1050]